MKRLFCLFLVIALLWGCAPAQDETTETTAPTETTEVTEPAMDLTQLRESLPTMDGSTSLIPLEAAIRAAIFDISMEEATDQVRHTTTWDAFYKLLRGEVDMIFSSPLSQLQLDEAQAQGVTLELVPVAMEGFVFVVNADNPVDTLTQQQLKDIYSGKITNWSEVGGPDMPITAYQRNRDSGSQNFMVEFMGDTPLTDAPTELRPASMSGLMDVIAYNDNALGSIGYSVYAYAANMYGGSSEIKFIRVDGVEPSRAAFADGSYPLLGRYSAVFRSGEPEDSPVRQLVEFMTSLPGQRAIAQAGYVTMLDTGYEYGERTLELYRGTGSGPIAREPASYEYELLCVRYDEWGVYWSEGFDLTDNRVTGLANPALEREVNDFLESSLTEMDECREEFLAYVDAIAGNGEYPEYSAFETPYVSVTCRNGYLSAVVALTYSYNIGFGGEYYYRVNTANWDIFTGRRLEPEDLFCDGVDVDAVLNDALRAFSQESPSEGMGAREMKQEFAGLTEDGWCMTCDTIYLDSTNPWFAHGFQMSLKDLPEGVLAVEQPADFSDELTGEDLAARKRFRTIERDTVYEYVEDIPAALLDEDACPTAPQINEAVRDYLRSYFTEDTVLSYFEEQGFDTDRYWYMADWYLTNYGGHYVVFEGYVPEAYDEATGQWHSYPINSLLIFDLYTGKEITWQEMLLPGWEEASSIVNDSTGLPEQMPDSAAIRSIGQSSEGLWLYIRDENSTYYSVDVPADYINW